MSKTKVVLRVNTVGARSGDTLEVDADTAKELIDNGHALSVKDAPAEVKGK